MRGDHRQSDRRVISDLPGAPERPRTLPDGLVHTSCSTGAGAITAGLARGHTPLFRPRWHRAAAGRYSRGEGSCVERAVVDCYISVNGLPRVCPKADGHDRLLLADSGASLRRTLYRHPLKHHAEWSACLGNVKHPRIGIRRNIPAWSTEMDASMQHRIPKRNPI